MKFWLGNIIILVLFTGAISVLYHAKNPERTLVGKWEEVSWEFERVNVDTALINSDFEQYQRNEIYKNLIIHHAEVWEFSPEKKLFLNNNPASNINWAIKGRGHVLELKYGGAKSESYQVQHLSDDKLVVFFNFDLQIRGIVKMTFKKINDSPTYAQKI
jgi:hypothetical protein